MIEFPAISAMVLNTLLSIYTLCLCKVVVLTTLTIVKSKHQSTTKDIAHPQPKFSDKI